MASPNQTLADNKLVIFICAQGLVGMFLISQGKLLDSDLTQYWWIGVACLAISLYLFIKTHQSNESSKKYAEEKEEECIRLSHKLNTIQPMKEPTMAELDENDFMVRR